MSPAPRTVIAIDPVPRDRQRVLFEAQGAGGELTWVLGDEDLGPADRVITWRPRPGRHTLRLVDGARRAVDAVSFEVRGRPSP